MRNRKNYKLFLYFIFFSVGLNIWTNRVISSSKKSERSNASSENAMLIMHKFSLFQNLKLKSNSWKIDETGLDEIKKFSKKQYDQGEFTENIFNNGDDIATIDLKVLDLNNKLICAILPKDNSKDIFKVSSFYTKTDKIFYGSINQATYDCQAIIKDINLITVKENAELRKQIEEAIIATGYKYDIKSLSINFELHRDGEKYKPMFFIEERKYSIDRYYAYIHLSETVTDMIIRKLGEQGQYNCVNFKEYFGNNEEEKKQKLQFSKENKEIGEVLRLDGTPWLKKESEIPIEDKQIPDNVEDIPAKKDENKKDNQLDQDSQSLEEKIVPIVNISQKVQKKKDILTGVINDQDIKTHEENQDDTIKQEHNETKITQALNSNQNKPNVKEEKSFFSKNQNIIIPGVLIMVLLTGGLMGKRLINRSNNHDKSKRKNKLIATNTEKEAEYHVNF